MKKVVVIGAGPAGLTAAYELVDKSAGYQVTLLEQSGQVGGIAKTIHYKGNRMDMGGHRFFSKVPEVNRWWEKIMPLQGALPADDKALGRVSSTVPGGPDPQQTDRVMLRRNRLSRIYFNRKFFDYPVSLKWQTFANLGLFTTLRVGISYLASVVHKRAENSLEDFYINRFGKKLYSLFFENYTENVWGRHPRDISPTWGEQRVKGLSIPAILKDRLGKILHLKNRRVETSLIEEFSYPKFGPGQLWELTAQEIVKKGGTLEMNTHVVGLLTKNGKITGVRAEKDGITREIPADYVISSMPLKDLVAALENPPAEIATIAQGLPYRDYMTLGVLVKHLHLPNTTKIKTWGNIVPDNWVYVHDKSVQLGRFQIYNNWSPYMVKDVQHTAWLGLEYFCNEGDALWSLTDEQFAQHATQEMVRIGLIKTPGEVLDYHVERVQKAYPAYFDTYEQMDTLRNYLNTFPNLFCVGRNGQHRYNNMDHSMCTSFEAVKNLLAGTDRKANIWNVNTETEYHEQTQKTS